MDTVLEQRFTALEQGFIALEERFTHLEMAVADVMMAMQRGFERMEKGFALMNERMDNFEIRLGVVEKDVSKIKITLLDIQEELMGYGRAIDKDAVTLVNHEKRIGRLEKTR